MSSGNTTTLRCTEVLGGDSLLLFSHDVRGPNPAPLKMRANDEQRFGPAILCALLAVVQLPILYFFPLPRRYFYIRLACYSLLALWGLLYGFRAKPEAFSTDKKYKQ